MAYYNDLDEVLENLDDDNFISGEVIAAVDDLLLRSKVEFLAFLSEEMIGSDLLVDIEYKPVDIESEYIVFKVRGNVEEYLAENDYPISSD